MTFPIPPGGPGEPLHVPVDPEEQAKRQDLRRRLQETFSPPGTAADVLIGLENPTLDHVRRAAHELYQAGLSIYPTTTDGNKAPGTPLGVLVATWRKLQYLRIKPELVAKWWGPGLRSHGLGVFCGVASGDADTIEFDVPGLFEQFVKAAIACGMGDLVERIRAGWSERSPGGGIHLHFICGPVPGNKTLARRVTDQPMLDPNGLPLLDHAGKPRMRIKALIQTRGQGGWIVVAPSFGPTHPSGKPYVRLAGSPATMVTIIPEERDELWELARSFDEMPVPELAAPRPAKGRGKAREPQPGEILPGDDFNARAAWADILPQGWVLVLRHGDTEYWRRPGKDRGISATVNRDGHDRLYVFSSSTEFKPEEPYSKFAAFCLLRHGGDFHAAAQALYAQGYGTRHERQQLALKPTLDAPANSQRRHQPSANGHAPTRPAPIGPDSDQVEPVDDGLPSEIKNYRWDLRWSPTANDGNGANVPIKVPLRVDEIVAQVRPLAGDWPRRVGKALFLQGAGHKPVFIDNADQLMAWCDRLAQVDWIGGPRLVTQARFYQHLRMEAEMYDAIEVLPHWPPIPNILYMHPELPAPGRYLQRLLEFFSPLTPADSSLIRAFILTLFWGGPPGRRPAFLITGPDEDTARSKGRGLGKTTLLDLIVNGLVGGSIAITDTDKMAEVKTRLFSYEGTGCRVLRRDNVKTLRFSWADLESFITDSVISGRALYLGEARRPNTLTCVITLNGASLSKDLAQRVVVVKLARPKYVATWEEEIRNFLTSNRWQIIADIGVLLSTPVPPIQARTRWSEWEQGVLSRCGDLAALQALVAERQGDVDDDDDETHLLREYIYAKIGSLGFDPDKTVLFIPSQIAATWLRDCMGWRGETNQATAVIRRIGVEEMIYQRGNVGRGWQWRGLDTKQANPPRYFDWAHYCSSADQGRPY